MAIDISGPFVLAGAGKMGRALLEGLLARGLPAGRVIIQDPQPSAEIRNLAGKHNLALEASLSALGAPPEVILVAVKPQIMDSVFPALANLAGPATLTLSIAAGRPLASFEKHLGTGAAVIRAMPNTPAAIGRGMTVCCANRFVSKKQRALAGAILAAVGDVAWIDDESLMDAVTAVSGSGPAYVFLFAECLAQAGVEAGLNPQLAAQLARATVSGAGELLHRSPDDAAALRQNVTSPGGTTAAALTVLMGEDGLEQLMRRAVAAAVIRGRELAK